MMKEILENFWDIIRDIIQFSLIKNLVKVVRVWRKKEVLKMKRNKRNRNIHYVIFRDSTLNRISNVLLNRTKSFSRTFVIDLAN